MAMVSNGGTDTEGAQVRTQRCPMAQEIDPYQPPKSKVTLDDAKPKVKSIIAEAWRFRGVCFAYAATATVVFFGSVIAPGVRQVFVLVPQRVINWGEIWRIVTYPLVHMSLLHLVTVGAVLIMLGWIVEQQLRRSRSIVAMIAGAALPGVGYVLVEREQALVGGAFIASTFAAAFICLWIRGRQVAPKWHAILVALAGAYAVLVLASSLRVIVPYALSWVVGGAIALSERKEQG